MPEQVQNVRRKDRGLAVLRMITGLLMVYHGLEIFSAEKMENYLGWDSIRRLPFSTVLVYVGKSCELIPGILLTLGLYTRWAALALAFIMLFICFYIGEGRFWYEDQHPFIFAMMALVFAISGPGSWSLDNLKQRK